jgi:hypothetical protein
MIDYYGLAASLLNAFGVPVTLTDGTQSDVTCTAVLLSVSDVPDRKAGALYYCDVVFDDAGQIFMSNASANVQMDAGDSVGEYIGIAETNTSHVKYRFVMTAFRDFN